MNQPFDAVRTNVYKPVRITILNQSYCAGCNVTDNPIAAAIL